MATSATTAARAAAQRRVRGGIGSVRASHSDAPARMKEAAVAGFMATASPMPRLSGSMSSHHPSRVAAPTKTTAALAPWVNDRVVAIRYPLSQTTCALLFVRARVLIDEAWETRDDPDRCCPLYEASSTSRTLRARESGVNGFWRYAV